MENKHLEFQERMVKTARGHGAVNNIYLRKFVAGDLALEEVTRFATEFHYFSRNVPLVVSGLLANTANEEEALEITKILVSELGDGNPTMRHELLYRNFLRSIGIDPYEILELEPLPSTKNWVATQLKLYQGTDHFVALGASFGLEHVAIPMFDQLISGLTKYRQRWWSYMDMVYFTLHRQLEDAHEDAMSNALKIHLDKPAIQDSFQRGLDEVLVAEEEFWKGLNNSRLQMELFPQRESSLKAEGVQSSV